MAPAGQGGSSSARNRPLSIVSPVGYSASSCGYCTPPSSGVRSKSKSSRSYGVWAHRLSPFHYQRLIDRGWRRSGDYVYKPDNARTCCAQLPIRLRVAEFVPCKGQRRALTDLLFHTRQSRLKPARWKGRWSRGRDWQVEARWDEIEAYCSQQGQVSQAGQPEQAQGSVQRPWVDAVAGPVTNKFELTLRLSSSTDEKYDLFRRYQSRIHGEPDAKISSREGWERFLVNSNMLLAWPTTGAVLDDLEETTWRGRTVDPHDPQQEIPYGCYHHEYRLDGKLIAVGVLDILPACVSSVYLFYDPDYEHLQIGKISALREIALTKQLQRKAGMEALQHYYLGFYIHSCQKMRYKAEFKPCELLDCASNTWHAYTQVKGALDAGVRYDFEQDLATSSSLVAGEHRDPDQPSTAPGLVDDSQRSNTGNDGSDGDSDVSEPDDTAIPTDPTPPPGMLDPRALLEAIRAAPQMRNPATRAGLELVARALVLEAARQHDGIRPLLMSPFARAYVQTGACREFTQALEGIAALADEELVSQCVLFL